VNGMRRATALVVVGIAAVAAASGIAIGADSSLGERTAACILFGHDPGLRSSKPAALLALGETVEYSARTTSDRTIALVAMGRASVAWNSSGGDPQALEATVRAEQREREAAERALAECPVVP
jgi:hypothetical protein